MELDPNIPRMVHSSGILCSATASSRWNTAHWLLVISSQPWPCSVHSIPSSPAALSCFCIRFDAWIFLPRLWTPCTLGSQAPCDCAFLGSVLLPTLQYYPKVWSRFPCPNPRLWPSLNLKSLFNIIINREKVFYFNFSKSFCPYLYFLLLRFKLLKYKPESFPADFHAHPYYTHFILMKKAKTFPPTYMREKERGK